MRKGKGAKRWRNGGVGLVALACLAAGAVEAHAQAKAWVGMGGINGDVYVLESFKGTLYAGGEFTSAGGRAAKNIARWNGTTWTNLGGGLGGNVSALAHDGTNLYAGGVFTNAGGRAAFNIAKWNGTTWTNLGGGMPPDSFGLEQVDALLWHGGILYAGGYFTNAGGVAVQNIAKWNGAAWSGVGEGVDGQVATLAHDGTNLYAAGTFLNAGGMEVNGVAKWNGTAWSAMGGGAPDGSVCVLRVFGGTLYAAGAMSTMDGVTVSNVARWTGTQWTSLGVGLRGKEENLVMANAMATDGTNLYVGGGFIAAGGVAANCVAMWNGSAWTNLGSGVVGDSWTDQVLALAFDGTNLHAGGYFTNMGGKAAAHIARWAPGPTVVPASGPKAGGTVATIRSGTGSLGSGRDITNVTFGGVKATIQAQGAAWVRVKTPAAGAAGVKTIVVRSKSVGATTLADAYTYHPAGRIFGTFGGGEWTQRMDNSGGEIYAMTSDGTHLYVGGYFTHVGGVAAKNIAKWNGTSWTNLGSGLGSYVSGLVCLGSRVYAGGAFTNAGAVAAAHVAMWNGSAWTNLGAGTDGVVFDMVFIGTNLYIGGGFSRAGSVNAKNVAKWNGSAWTNLGAGLNDEVVALTTDGTRLYAGGIFTSAGGVAANRVAMWNGSVWTNLGSGVSDQVSALAHDGVNLYAGGLFTQAEGLTANRVAMWNGSAWTGLGGQAPGGVSSLVRMGTHLYMGGNYGAITYSCYVYETAMGTGVSPVSGPKAGGYRVTISGADLGDGSDVTNVTLCGVKASAIVSQSSTQVVVKAGASTKVVRGAVKVFSTSRGATTKSNAFSYANLAAFQLQAVALTNRVVLRWPDPKVYGNGSAVVQLRYSASSYPAVGEGSLLYSGTNRVFQHTGRTPGQACYYSLFVSDDGTTFVEPP